MAAATPVLPSPTELEVTIIRDTETLRAIGRRTRLCRTGGVPARRSHPASTAGSAAAWYHVANEHLSARLRRTPAAAFRRCPYGPICRYVRAAARPQLPGHG